MSSVVGKAGKLFDTHYSSASRSTNGCRVDKIQVQVQNKSGELGVGGATECVLFGDSSADKDPVDSEIPLPAPNGIKLARFVLALTRLPVF